MGYRHTMAMIAALALAGCSGNSVKTTLGLDRGSPDEFRVVSRPPLSVPPQFNLRPPAAAGTDNGPGQVPTSGQAQALLTGSVNAGNKNAAPVATVKSGSAAESAFLQNVGAAQADPAVREKITQDQIAAAQPAPEEIPWWNFWTPKPKQEPIVNANQESDRIKTDQDAGQPVTTGDTAVVKQRDTGLMGQIFGY